MKKIIIGLFALCLPFLTATSVVADDYTEGKEYLKLSSPQPTASSDKIEVVELFWYGCPHCYRLEPTLSKWLQQKPDDVEFVRLPAILGKSWELLANAYYVAELLGISDKMHTAIFEVLHKDRKKINDEDALRKVFVEHGVSEKDFNATFNSFAVSVKLNNARKMTSRYAITGVPTLIVNGKYSTTPGKVGSNKGVPKMLDFLIDRERKLIAATASPGS